jgi:hypothetical protein
MNHVDGSNTGGFSGGEIDSTFEENAILVEIGNDIAPVGLCNLSAREQHAMILKDKGVRGPALQEQMELFDKAKTVEGKAAL